MNILKGILYSLLGMFLVVCSIAAWDVHLFLKDLRPLAPKVSTLTDNLNETAIGANKVVGVTYHAAQDISNAAKQQTKTAQQIELETYKTMASVRLLVVRMDHDVIPRANKILDDADNGVVQSTNDLKSLQGLIAQSETLVASLQGQVSDPKIQDTLTQLDLSAKAANASLVELQASATDVHQIADKARETYLKPVKLWLTLLKFVVPIVPEAVVAAK
jgi:hypothetical protein